VLKLFEHEAKEIFSKYEIPIPKGGLANSPAQARRTATRVKGPVALKAQVLAAGRGRAGGILFADSPREAELSFGKLLGSEIRGLRVQSILVEEKLPISKELYFGITLDRSSRSFVAIASSDGGVEIEETAATTPEKIVRLFVDPLFGFRPYHARQIAKKLGYMRKQMRELTAIFLKLYKVVVDYDAELCEMNPLVETTEGKFVAADARLIIDDNALYRHPDFRRRLIEKGQTELTTLELEAHKKGLTYVKLDGNIGVIGNGAGLVMATMDAIHLFGGKPANFLDVGGGASSDKMAAALNLVLSDPRIEVVFINVLGGITRCNEIAEGILEARKRIGFAKPMVIRLMGTNEEEGKHVLLESGIQVLDSMEQAAEKAVEIAKAGR